MNIQLVGIDEEAFQAASEEQRIEWGKQNTTAGFGLCEGALGWLQERQDSVGVCFFATQSRFPCNDYAEKDEYIYRLAPDYQPPVKRWWFDTITKSIIEDGQTVDQNMIEVTEDFARYVQNKPDCECELRLPEAGDNFLVFSGALDRNKWIDLHGPCESTNPKLYRWCKPRKPEYGWMEYDVKPNVNGYYCVQGKIDNINKLSLVDAANRVGFGGVKFEGQASSTWYTITNAFLDGFGYVHIDSESGMTKPATPVKVRFWREVTK